MQEVLLSIVIPCYNSFELLGRALAVFEKNIRDYLEIIFIDDCSTDNTCSRLEEYKSNSEINIQIFQNEINSGPGISRNLGIEKAKGKYITFMDSDDWFEDSFFEMVKGFLDSEPDCVIFDYEDVYMNGKKRSRSIFFSMQEEGSIPVEVALMHIRGAAWGKIYRKKIIDENNLKFMNQMINEDMSFTKLAVSKCETIVYTKSFHYEYYQNQSSLMHNRKLLDPKNAYNAFMDLYQKIDSVFSSEVEGIFILECFYSMAISNSLFMNRKEWKEHVSKLKKMFPNLIKNQYYSSYSIRIRIFVLLIYNKQYNLVKLLAKIQNWIKIYIYHY